MTRKLANSIFTLMMLLSLILMACDPTPQGPTVTPSPAPGQATYEKADCPFPNKPSGVSVECGYLVVPEDRSNPSSPMIKVAVAVFKSTSATPEPDPIVYLEGGPGGSPLRAYLRPGYFEIIFQPLLQNRDLILIDQRGTGYSQPALDCPEVYETQINMFNQNLSIAEAETRGEVAVTACHDRLKSQGINLAAYNSAENAADLADLRALLGYDQWNLYGISYGTRLALTTMRDHPAGLRSVVIDSVYPPQASLVTEVPANVDRAFNLMFDTCAADPVCNAAYPNLRQVFFDTVNTLNETPVSIILQVPTLPNVPNSGSATPALLNGDAFLNLVFQSMYATSILPSLPQMIYEVKNGDYGSVVQIQNQFMQSWEDISQGMYNSVQCYEEVSFSTAEQMQAALDAYPELGNSFGTAEGQFKTCQTWAVGSAPAIENQIVTSDIPTLVMAGKFDPITPPAWAQSVAQGLSKSFYVEVPNGGHGSSLTETCPRSIFTAFLDDPSQKPDSTCLDQTRFAFSVPLTSIELDLAPFSGSNFQTVMPSGWKDVGLGLYSPTGAATDLDQIFIQAGEVDAATFLNLFSSQLEGMGMSLIASDPASRTANGLTWNLYTNGGGITRIDIAIAEKNSWSYIILMQSTSSDRAALLDALLYPMIDAFQITQ
jgi:pimeloyl-ACP methyl ester carboxylesterase